MKRTFKRLSALFTAMVIMSSMFVFSASAAEFEIGDVEMNNSVDSSDALLVIRTSVGLASMSSEQAALADFNGDTVIDSTDALLILQRAIGIGAPQTASPVSSSLSSTQKTPEKSFAEQVVELTNAERAKAGLAPVELVESLCDAAETRIKEINENFGHVRPNDTKWSTVLGDVGIRYLCASENIAGGVATPEDVVKAWMDSEGHRKNILNPDFNKIGVAYGFIEDSRYGYYWDQIFIGSANELANESASLNELLEHINSVRKANGLCELKLDTDLAKAAETRADEITALLGNERPNGTSWSTLLDELGVECWSLAQSYCAGQQTVDDVISYFEDGGTPKYLNAEKDYLRIGIGHAFVENDEYGHYWVIILTD